MNKDATITMPESTSISAGTVMTVTSVATKIYVTFRLPGIHNYPDAPEEVAFLRHPHRHMFHFKVTIDVYHDDREIEFYIFLNWLRSLYGTQLSLDHKSCEMIARELIDKVQSKYGYERTIEVDVSEDGECGSVVTSGRVVS